MAKGESQQVTTTSSEPSEFQKPYLEKGFKAADAIFASPGPSFAPFSAVQGFSPEQEQSFAGGMAHAQNAAGFNADVLAGNYMQNPNDDAVFANIQSKVMPSVGSQFSGSGRFGSSLHADTAARGLTEAYAPYAAAQWQQGLDRRTAAGNNYTPFSMMEGIGGQRQQLAQRERDEATGRYNFEQEKAANKLREYMGFIGGNYGQNTTSTTPYQTQSPWATGIGALLGLASL